MSLDVRPYFIFQAQAIAEGAGKKERGFKSAGFSGDPCFFDEGLLRRACAESGQIALQNLKARPAPAGKFPVIITQGLWRSDIS